MTTQPRAGPGRLAAVALLVLVCGAQPADAGLTAVNRLATVYDSILDARFEEAATELHAACPPAPTEACRALEAVSLWWQILITPDDHSLDEQLERASAEAITAADAWTHREPQRAEAWFYLAGSYAPRVQLHVLRKNRLRAALDGNRIRAALERALQLDPSLADAYFGIGLYHYYAAVAPPVARLLRRLLFLPGGDRAQGLREITEARTRGDLLRGEADYQLLVLDLWYEGKPAEAMDLLAGLDRRYSHNPLFRERMATVCDEYLHDHAASAANWRNLVDRAVAGRVYRSAATEIEARLGLATQLLALGDRDGAIAQARIVIDRTGSTRSSVHDRATALLRAADADRTER